MRHTLAAVVFSIFILALFLFSCNHIVKIFIALLLKFLFSQPEVDKSQSQLSDMDNKGHKSICRRTGTGVIEQSDPTQPPDSTNGYQSLSELLNGKGLRWLQCFLCRLFLSPRLFC